MLVLEFLNALQRKDYYTAFKLAHQLKKEQPDFKEADSFLKMYSEFRGEIEYLEEEEASESEEGEEEESDFEYDYGTDSEEMVMEKPEKSEKS